MKENLPEIKEVLGSEAFSEIQKEISKESDRGCILVAIAALDDMFENRLREELKNKNSETLKRLLSPPLGYLSGFMAKADLLYSLGILHERNYKEIKKLNKLRNKCAHEWKTFKFTEDIYNKYLINDLATRMLEEKFIYWPKFKKEFPLKNKIRHKCEFVIVLIIIILNVMLKFKPKRDKKA